MEGWWWWGGGGGGGGGLFRFAVPKRRRQKGRRLSRLVRAAAARVSATPAPTPE